MHRAPSHRVPRRAGALPWRRDVSYHMPIKQRMGPPMAHTTETQVLRALARNAWTVEVSAQTPNVPLGSTFRTLVKFTARAAADGGTDLHVSGQVKFFSSGLGPLRGMIQSASVEGMRSTYAAVAAELRAAFVAEKPTLPASGLVAPPAQGGKLRPLPQQALVAPVRTLDPCVCLTEPSCVLLHPAIICAYTVQASAARNTRR